MSAHYAFTTRWLVPATVERVWEAIAAPDLWPTWWPGVEAVELLRPGDGDGIGAVRRFTWRSRLPYRLTFTMETTRQERLSQIEGRATGELAGRGRWHLSREGDATRVEYDWEVEVAKPWMRLAGFALRPLFRWNHDAVMEWGRQGLLRHLASPPAEPSGQRGAEGRATSLTAPERRSGSVRRLVALALACLALATGVIGFAAPAGPRSLARFDPDRTADLEVAMWRAYYGKEKFRLFALLVETLREQYGYSWARASEAGFHLARAAAVFGDAQSGYDRVLPDLERGYAIARDWTGAGFDPAAVARAELAWWVARRTRGQDAAENVGRLVAGEYSLLYEVPASWVRSAGLLRAEAGALRDRGGAQADWPEVSRLLHRSYAELRSALDDRSPGARIARDEASGRGR